MMEIGEGGKLKLNAVNSPSCVCINDLLLKGWLSHKYIFLNGERELELKVERSSFLPRGRSIVPGKTR